MQTRTIILFVVLFITVVIGMFTFTYLKKSELPPPVAETPAPAVPAKPYVTRIDAKHFFINGVHTYVGQVDLPTPCDLLQANALVMESMPEQIRVNFTVLNNSDTCEQKVTTQRFKVSATASEKATVSATFMGQPIEFNLIPAVPGETPEQFELFVKG